VVSGQLTRFQNFMKGCLMINWDNIIEQISILDGVPITTDPSRWNLDTPGYTEIYDIWKKANFNSAAIKWINYYPEQHFSKTVINEVAESLGLAGVHRAWISRIDPGYMAPWHWDVDDNEEEYLRHGHIWRYTIIIRKFAHGHIFIIDDQYYYNQEKDTVISWKHHRDWHSGINAGMEPNYMLHVLGYRS